MADEKPDPFEQIRNEAQAVEPTEDDLDRGYRRLQASMADQRLGRRCDRVRIVSMASVVLLVVIAGLALFRPNAANATLREIAEAARRASPHELPSGSFAYPKSEKVELMIRPGVEFGLDQEYVAFLLPSVRETWRQPASDFIQIRTVNGPPRFFDTDVEAAYYEFGFDSTVDRLGIPVTNQFTGVNNSLQEVAWPTEAGALYDALLDHVSRPGDERPAEVAVFDVAALLLTEMDPSPDLRAAVVEVLTRLPIEVIEGTDGGVTLAIEGLSPIPSRETISLDPEGDLIGRTTTWLQDDVDIGVPGGTVVYEVRFLERGVVDDL